MIVFTSRERQRSVSGDMQAQTPLLSRSVSVTCVNWMPEFLSVLQESLEWLCQTSVSCHLGYTFPVPTRLHLILLGY